MTVALKNYLYDPPESISVTERLVLSEYHCSKNFFKAISIYVMLKSIVQSGLFVFGVTPKSIYVVHTSQVYNCFVKGIKTSNYYVIYYLSESHNENNYPVVSC